jgi:hypothetical protein
MPEKYKPIPITELKSEFIPIYKNKIGVLFYSNIYFHSMPTEKHKTNSYYNLNAKMGTGSL